jgi:undecaprenyl-diphosphatase
MNEWLAALILGLVEGITEFIPVSSTGHLILAQHLLGLPDAFWGTFIVMIQLGAILSVVVLYFARLWQAVITLPSDPASRRFALSVIVAFLPAMVLGVLLHDVIKRVLFASPAVICWSLIIGGVALLAIDRWQPRPRHRDATALPLRTSLLIGFFQCLAMIPGVSRSGATIAGALLMGTDKRTAAEFSFFLAMPTMVGAFVYDLYANRKVLSANDAPIIAIGFVAAFIVALIVVHYLLDYVSKRGYALFGWWRLLVGGLGLAALTIWG